MKKNILTLAFLLCAVAGFGQNKQEVIRLKNGTVVKGAVVGEANDSIAMQTSDGSVFIFANSDITERMQDDATTVVTHSVTAQPTPTSPRQTVAPKSAPVTTEQPQVVYIQPEKSPALAGILSYLFPGAGQFYYGNNKLGKTDLAEHITCLVLTEGGKYLYNRFEGENDEVAATGLRCYVVGLIWGAVNQICSIVDAVKGAKAFNHENGYTMYDVGGGVSVGARPQLTYEHPEYAMQIPNSLNAGIGFRIAF